MGIAHQVLQEGLQRAFGNTRRLLDDVDEADCFWEPATPCWSVRPRASAGRAWGTGEWVCEDAWPAPDPLPITTIAWRTAHLAAWTDVYRAWTFENRRLDLSELDVPGSRDGLVQWLHAAQDHFMAPVEQLADEELEELRPAHYGVDTPVHRLVGIITNEHVHHGAEIGLLRDLRRGHAKQQPSA